MSRKLEGKIALVTGGSTGIGLATAQEFVAEGAYVFITGRRQKELDDDAKPTSARSALTTIVNDGKEMKILRHNMPFGRASLAEFGTYFLGYSRSPHTLEQMPENMFVGRPPGNYDRLLDYSRPVTGALFFAPTQSFLDDLDQD